MSDVSPVPSTLPLSRLNPVFVLALPRSGSTLVQRVLNVHPGLTIWGEHNGILGPFSVAYRRLYENDVTRLRMLDGAAERDLIVGPLADPHEFIAWTNPRSPGEYQNMLRELVLEMFAADLPEDVRWGFKEIRYGADVARFLIRMFPRSRFVFPVRDLTGQVRSRILMFDTVWDAEAPDVEKKLMARVSRFADQWIERHVEVMAFSEEQPHACIPLVSQRLTDDPRTANALFSALGLDPVHEESIERVTTVRAGEYRDNGRWSDIHKEQLEAAIDNHQFDEKTAVKLKEVSDFFGLG